MPSTSTAGSSYAARLILLTSILFVTAQAAAWTRQGCFKSSTPLTSKGSYTYQSNGYCMEECAGNKVFALTEGDTCLCGNMLPAASDEVSDSRCDAACQGYGEVSCGGDGFYEVYTIGSADVDNYGGGDDSNTKSTSSASRTQSDGATPSVITSVRPGTTVRITMAPSSAASSEEESGSGGGDSSNTAGIAAGVVAGVVALAALAGLAFFLIRRKRRQAAAEEYTRNNPGSDFMGRKPPATGYSQMSDSRLDPEASAKRNSSGSIADAGDYSRRILRVANPDRD